MERKLGLGYEFFIKVMGKPNYSFTMSSSKKKLYDNWVAIIKDHYGETFISLGDNFLWEYIIFQLNRYSDSEITVEPFSWFFGKKAAGRWIEKHEAWRWASSQTFGVSEYQLYENDFTDYINEVKEPNSAAVLRKHHESIRLHQNLARCVVSTPLYNVLSISCIKCPFKDDCKQIKRHKEKTAQ